MQKRAVKCGLSFHVCTVWDGYSRSCSSREEGGGPWIRGGSFSDVLYWTSRCVEQGSGRAHHPRRFIEFLGVWGMDQRRLIFREGIICHLHEFPVCGVQDLKLMKLQQKVLPRQMADIHKNLSADLAALAAELGGLASRIGLAPSTQLARKEDADAVRIMQVSAL